MKTHETLDLVLKEEHIMKEENPLKELVAYLHDMDLNLSEMGFVMQVQHFMPLSKVTWYREETHETIGLLTLVGENVVRLGRTFLDVSTLEDLRDYLDRTCPLPKVQDLDLFLEDFRPSSASERSCTIFVDAFTHEPSGLSCSLLWSGHDVYGTVDTVEGPRRFGIRRGTVTQAHCFTTHSDSSSEAKEIVSFLNASFEDSDMRGLWTYYGFLNP